MNIILGVTGSVAGVLTPKLITALTNHEHEIQIVATTPGLYFLPEPSSEDKIFNIPIFKDKDEWPEGGFHKQDPVRHIEFREWADLLLIAPLSANTLAKVAGGICDNFLCCIARAWQKDKPLVVAPAMNTEMWIDPITGEHLALLPKRYKSFHVVEPVQGNLACGGVGLGAMARIEKIVEKVNSLG